MIRYYVLKLRVKNPNRFTKRGLFICGKIDDGLSYSRYIDEAIKFIDLDDIDLYLSKSKTKYDKEDFFIEYYMGDTRIALIELN